MPPLAILAGGLATRLRPLTETIPKSMLDVGGEPFIARQLRLFRDKGVRRAVLCTGFLGSMIEDFVGDGSRYGLIVTYSRDGDRPLGTGGALKRAMGQLGDTFMVVYGDSWLDTDYAAIVRAFEADGRPALMTVFRNENAWDKSNVEFDGATVRRYDKVAQTPAMHHIDWGLGLFRAAAFAVWATVDRFDLAEVYARMVAEGKLIGYEVKERFYEIGSLAGLNEAAELLGRRN